MALLFKYASNNQFLVQWGKTMRNVMVECDKWRNKEKEENEKLVECLGTFLSCKDYESIGNYSYIIFLANTCLMEIDQFTPTASLVKILNQICIESKEDTPEETLELIFYILKGTKPSLISCTLLSFSEEAFVNGLVKCIKSVFGKCSRQLSACSCLSLLSRKFPSERIMKIISVSVIPCLLSIISVDLSYGRIRFFDRTKAVITLAHTIADNEHWQRVAWENCGIPKLHQILVDAKEEEKKISSLTIENSLLALSGISAFQEEIRSMVFLSPQLVQMIVLFLEHPSDNVKNAACLCIKSLSRSPKGLRTSLCEFDIIQALSKVLSYFYASYF